MDEEVETFINNIEQAAWENTLVGKRRTTGNNYPKEIRDIIAKKRKLRCKWQQSRYPQYKTNLNNDTQQLKREIHHIQNKSINTYLRSLTSDSATDYSLWKTTKRLKSPIMHIPPIRQEDGKWVRNNTQKADIFANI